MIDQWEAAEQESEQRKTHNESQRVRDWEHVHAILFHFCDLEPDIVLEEVTSHETDGAHQTRWHVCEGNQ